VARASYTDRDRALVYAELTANGGNIKRTARHLGIPMSTIRRWRDLWEHEGGVPESVQLEIAPATADFLTDAKRVRNKLLARMEQLADNGDKLLLRDVATSIGILSDKVRAYESINDVKKVEHSLVLPDPEELRELMMGAVEGVVGAAQKRAAELAFIEHEPVETTNVLELMPGKTN
jgi:transposase-like protein